jgi:cytochrome b
VGKPCSNKGLERSVHETKLGERAFEGGTFQAVRIWDLPTRLFHWLLVLAVAIAGYTGFLGPPWQLSVHVWAGYIIGILVLFRIVWGFTGSEYSRLDRLLNATRHVRGHLTDLARLKPRHYLGHNPAGSAMILALLTVLLLIVGTGLIVLGGMEKQGPFEGVFGFGIGQLAKGVHQVLAYALAVMILGHLCGVALETVLLKVPLVGGMVTGWLPAPVDDANANSRPVRPLLAAGLALALAGAIGTATLALSRLPAYGVPDVPVDAVYAKECGVCHWAFHPSLLPRAASSRIMATLDDHFGEDARLPPETAKQIANYLDLYAAETSDTEPANRLRELSESDPRSITATPFWQHHRIAKAVCSSREVKSRANCPACHHDAASGRFDDQQIQLPNAALNQGAYQ